MNNDKELFYLIANPLKINKEKIKKQKYIDKSLFNMIIKKYPQYVIDDDDFDIIKQNLEKLLSELTINNVTENLIKNVMNDVIKTI